jgi:hypothetical protein
MINETERAEMAKKVEVVEVETPNPKSLDEIKMLISKHQIGPESGSKARELLIEGLDNIKSRIEYNEKLKEAGNISLNVDQMGGWVHNLIRDTMGGKINSAKQTIIWEIKGKTVEYNPYDGNLEYAN